MITKRGFAAMPSSFPTKMLINNKWVSSVSGETFPTLNPSNQKELAKVPRGNSQDIDLAVAAAK